MSDTSTKILLVDDHELTHLGLKLLFREHPHYGIVGTLNQGVDVLPFIKKNAVDVIVLDLQLSDMNGIDLLAELVGRLDMTVVILTGQKSARQCHLALKMGARGVVSKADPSSEVIVAIEHAIQGKIYCSSAMRTTFEEANPVNIKLSPRQMAILHYMAQGESNKEIGYKLNIAMPTVSFHIGELREKLGVSSNRKIVPYAVELGLIDLLASA